MRRVFPNIHRDANQRCREKQPMTDRAQEICPDLEREERVRPERCIQRTKEAETQKEH